MSDFADLAKDAEFINFNSKAGNQDLLPDFKALRYVSTNKITPELVERLAQLPNLQVMQISSDKQETWPSLRPLSSLKYLILYNIKKLTSLDSLSGMTQLESLLLSELLKLTDISALATLANLRELSLEGDLHGRGSVLPDIDALFSLSKLEYLKFFSKKTQLNAADFQSLKKLRFLRIHPFNQPFEFYAELEQYLPGDCEKFTPYVLIDHPEDECPKCGAVGLIKPIGIQQRAFCPSCAPKKLDTLLDTYEKFSGKPREAAIQHISFLKDRA